MGKVRLNDNQEVVRTVREGLKRTGGYCPCRLERTEAGYYADPEESACKYVLCLE